MKDKCQKKCAEKESRIKELLQLIEKGPGKKHADMQQEVTKLQQALAKLQIKSEQTQLNMSAAFQDHIQRLQSEKEQLEANLEPDMNQQEAYRKLEGRLQEQEEIIVAKDEQI